MSSTKKKTDVIGRLQLSQVSMKMNYEVEAANLEEFIHFKTIAWVGMADLLLNSCNEDNMILSVKVSETGVRL